MAMAKYPEISYNIQFSNQWEKNLFSQSAQLLSENTYRLLLEHGCETIEQLRAGKTHRRWRTVSARPSR